MKQAGFTLFEVLLSVSIFLLMSAAIFMAVTAGIRTTTAIAQHRLHSDRVDTLLSFLRNVFTNLPPSAEICLQNREVSAGVFVSELLIQKAPGIFSWEEGNSGNHVISILTTSGGTLAIKSFRDTLSEDERRRFLLEKTGWTRLLDQVQRIRWRFFDTSSRNFLEEWNFGRPRLIEMTLWETGEDPVTAQFWIPEVQTSLQISKGIKP